MKKKTLGIVLIWIAISFFLKAQSQPQKFNIIDKIQLGGNTFWDYLASDDVNNRLFVSHGNMVQVINTKDDKLIGTISGLSGVHGIALAYDLNKGFISNGQSSVVTVFNLKTLAKIASIPVTGKNPDAILYDPFSHRVFTFNGRSSNSTVIDAKTGKVIHTIQLVGRPEFAVTDRKGKIYVNIEDKSLISSIDPVSFKTLKTWSVSPGEGPSGLAIDSKNLYLFSVCGNKRMVISDAKAGKVITSLPIGSHVDGTAFDPVYHLAYSSNGEGSLTVIKEENDKTFSVLTTVTTQKGARTIAVNQVTHRIYVPTSEFEPSPAQTNGTKRHRPTLKPGSFRVIVLQPE